jgi:hypothetical protein
MVQGVQQWLTAWLDELFSEHAHKQTSVVASMPLCQPKVQDQYLPLPVVAVQVMGIMQGKIQGDTFIVIDSFALPVEGTETRVNAQVSDRGVQRLRWVFVFVCDGCVCVCVLGVWVGQGV